MDKKTKGGIAELAVAARMMQEGWAVSFPFGERLRYDLVAEKNGIFIRVQVKYSTPKNGALRLNCYSSNNWSILKYSKKDIDVLAAYNPTDGKVYFVPSGELNDGQVNLRVEKTRNNQIKDVRFAVDYEVLTYSRLNP